ncbi:MAG: EamA family transporter, partial [Pseudomonadota bacterium]
MTPPVAELPSNLRGALCFVFGTALLVTNDTLVKLLSAEMPIGQLIFVRGWFAVGFTLAACWWLGVLGRWRGLGDKAVLARAGVNTFSMFTYMAALIHMPIANVAAITQAIPLALTAASALLLAERVGPRRWTAVAIGFAGVLFVIRPGGQNFNVWALSALLTVALIVVRDL